MSQAKAVSPQSWTLFTDKIVEFIAIPECPLAVEKHFAMPWHVLTVYGPINGFCDVVHKHPWATTIGQTTMSQPSVDSWQTVCACEGLMG